MADLLCGHGTGNLSVAFVLVMLSWLKRAPVPGRKAAEEAAATVVGVGTWAPSSALISGGDTLQGFRQFE